MVLGTHLGRNVPALALAHAGSAVNRNRPGWIDMRRSPYRQEAAPKEHRPGIICHECYVENDHISPDCTLPFRARQRVVDNYNKLTPAKKAMVPSDAFDAASLALGVRQQSSRDGQGSPEQISLIEESPGTQGNE